MESQMPLKLDVIRKRLGKWISKTEVKTTTNNKQPKFIFKCSELFLEKRPDIRS